MIVHSTADLRLLAAIPTLRALRRQEVMLAIDGFEPAERGRLQQRLNRLLHDCGCFAGALFSFGGGILTGLIAVRLAHYGVFRTGAAIFAALLLFGAIGKLSGLALASFRFRRLCLAIAARIPSAARP
jgi:hypothetical protein